MTDYKTIRGKKIKTFTTDLSDGDSSEGQIFYSDTSKEYKVNVGLDSWVSISSVTQSRDAAGSAGINTAAMIFGGRNEVDGGPTGGPNQQYNLTEEYNGTGFSAGGAMVQGRQGLGGTGTQTAGLGVGGYHPPAPGPKSLVEEYDGSSWSEVTNMPTATFAMGSAGTQTAALFSGGRTGSGWVNTTYEYDGTNWTTGGALGTARTLKSAMTGIQTAAVAFGGNLTPPGARTDKVEEYNGSSWSEVTALPAAKQSSMASGIQTAALNFGGSTPGATGGITSTFKYDGTNFSATSNMGSIILDGGTLKTASNNSTGLQMSGYGASSYTAISQEFISSANTVTAATWSSGGAYPTATADVGSAGTRTAGLCFGGDTPAPAVTAKTNEYDGTTFSEGGDTVSGRAFMTGLGTQTAAVGVGGAPSFVANSESYNGSSWSEGNNINTARGNAMAAGTQTAGLLFGGYNGSSLANTENYDGTSWTNNPNGLNTARRGSGGCGTQTAALCAAGYSTNFIDVVEEYNGTSWSEVTNVPLKRHAFRCVGTQTAALGSGGYLPGPQGGPGNLPTNSITYDGTSWSTNPSLATGNSRGGQAGTTTASFVTAGQLGSGTTTENFDGQTLGINLKTITDS